MRRNVAINSLHNKKIKSLVSTTVSAWRQRGTWAVALPQYTSICLCISQKMILFAQMLVRGLRLAVGFAGATWCWEGLVLPGGLALALLCLPGGLLAGAGLKRCLYFFPQRLETKGACFQSSFARFKRPQQESKSTRHLPQLLLMCDFTRSGSCGSWSFSCHG